MANRFAPIQVIDIDTAVNAGQTATVSGLNQAFELVNVFLDGADGCRAVVLNSGSTAATAFVGGVTNGQSDSSTELNNSNCTFAANAVITVQITFANATRIQLLCRAIDSVAREITVTVA